MFDGVSDNLTRKTAAPLMELYAVMWRGRLLDRAERRLAAAGQAFFHVSGGGHEAMAAWAAVLGPGDWLHLCCHDKALTLARGVKEIDFLRSLLRMELPHSRGQRMSVPITDPALHIFSLVGPLESNALQAVGVAQEIKNRPGRPAVLCCAGEGASQQEEFLEAVAQAVRTSAPVIFVVEEEGPPISTCAANPPGSMNRLMGLPIQRMNGCDPAACLDMACKVADQVRRNRSPAVVWFEAGQLSDRADAHHGRSGLSRPKRRGARKHADPVVYLRDRLLKEGVARMELNDLERRIESQLQQAVATALADSELQSAGRAERPANETFIHRCEYRGRADQASCTMLEAIRNTLRHHLQTDSSVTLLGEDIEDSRGDVFGITRGLSTEFSGRVINSSLSESALIGAPIGRALAGGRPVVFLQFADFLPLAFNQIISELGDMHWRMEGGWECPVIVLAACGGYRAGLGSFHAQAMEAICAHVPGVDIVMPSTAGDAAGMLNAAFASRRPTLYFYPKVCLNDRNAMTSPDVAGQFVPLGRARRLRRGDDLTLVTYGVTVAVGQQAAQALARADVGVDLIDLRSISPWDVEAVSESAARTGRVIVMHEDNPTRGFASGIMATLAEREAHRIKCRRILRADTLIPCNYPNQLEIVPSVEKVIAAAAEWLSLNLSGEFPSAARQTPTA